MKKLMIAAAVAAVATASFADIASENVVGYYTQSTSTAYPTVGCMFVTPGTGTFKLSDIVPTGAVYQEDYLQYIDPATSVIGDKYTWYTAADESEEDGWCYYGGALDEEYVPDSVTFPAGTAFLANFQPSHNVSLKYAGEVLSGPVTIQTKNSSDVYMPYPYIVNPLPVPVKMQDIIPTGAVYQEDYVQIIDPVTSIISDKYTWYDVVNEEGWCYYGGEKDEEYVEESVTIAPGDGFLGNFQPSHHVTLTFPSAL